MDPYEVVSDDSPCYDDPYDHELRFEDTGISPCFDDNPYELDIPPCFIDWYEEYTIYDLVDDDPYELDSSPCFIDWYEEYTIYDLVDDDPYGESPPNLCENPYDTVLLDEDHSNKHDNQVHTHLKTENEMLKHQLEMKVNEEEVVLQELSRMRLENKQLKEKLVQRKVSGCYPMKSMPRGIALIINNEKFKLKKMNRLGTDKDARGLQDLFTYLGFSLHRHDNLTGDEMMAVLAEAATMNHSIFDCLIVAILTHGGEGNVLYGTDMKEIAVRDIINIFRADNCPSLAGKPKIILLQACRGALTDKGTIASGTVDFMEESLLDAGPKIKNSRRKDTIPIMADFLIVCSTFSGYVAYRNHNKGSYFVSTLVDVLRRKAKDEPLHDMITEVIEQVSSLSISKGEKQVPQFKSSLRLKLYFNPE